MDTFNNEEKGLLGSSRSHKRYGSTIINMKKPEYVIRHQVSKSDTIQGIALRYGVSMAVVKQHNKFYTSDHLYLHDDIEVPVSKEVFDSHTTSSLPASPRLASPSEEQAPPTSPRLDYSDTDPLAFLSKIDSSIASTKTSVSKFDPSKYPVAPSISQMEVDDTYQRGKKMGRSFPSHRLSAQPFPISSSHRSSIKCSDFRANINHGFELDDEEQVHFNNGPISHRKNGSSNVPKNSVSSSNGTSLSNGGPPKLLSKDSQISNGTPLINGKVSGKTGNQSNGESNSKPLSHPLAGLDDEITVFTGVTVINGGIRRPNRTSHQLNREA